MNGRSKRSSHLVAIPWPGRGHVNALMNLCKLMVSKKPEISITFILTEEWFSFIGHEPKPSNIVFDTIPNVVPSEKVRAKDMNAFIQAVFTKMEAPLEDLLDQLDQQPDLIMADSFLSWAVALGNWRKIPIASFWAMSSVTFYYFHLLQQNERKIPVDLLDKADFPSVESEQSMRAIMEMSSWALKAQYVLLSSLYELEPLAIDALKARFPSVYAVGPCIPDPKPENEAEDYVQWLNRQPESSVLYVSQGSFLSVSSDQLDNIVLGLRDSKVRFLWVGWDESSRISLSCGDLGKVVPWCDQLRVLSHGSVGGFWTHCGWNSVKEGIFSGVPFLTFPIIMDQVPNSKLIVENWKVGWRVRDGSRKGILDLVRRFMDLEDGGGMDLRRRARELREVCRVSVAEGGSSYMGVNEFIEEIIGSK